VDAEKKRRKDFPVRISPAETNFRSSTRYQKTKNTHFHIFFSSNKADCDGKKKKKEEQYFCVFSTCGAPYLKQIAQEKISCQESLAEKSGENFGNTQNSADSKEARKFSKKKHETLPKSVLHKISDARPRP
jgi:hypothetical protein